MNGSERIGCVSRSMSHEGNLRFPSWLPSLTLRWLWDTARWAGQRPEVAGVAESTIVRAEASQRLNSGVLAWDLCEIVRRRLEEPKARGQESIPMDAWRCAKPHRSLADSKRQRSKAERPANRSSAYSRTQWWREGSHEGNRRFPSCDMERETHPIRLPDSASDRQRFFIASRLLNAPSTPSFSLTYRRTSSGSLFAYSRNAHPIALRRKNSFSPAARSMHS